MVKLIGLLVLGRLGICLSLNWVCLLSKSQKLSHDPAVVRVIDLEGARCQLCKVRVGLSFPGYSVISNFDAIENPSEVS